MDVREDLRAVVVWRNAGTPWWRKGWEGAFMHTHVWAWTEKGARRKTLKLREARKRRKDHGSKAK